MLERKGFGNSVDCVGKQLGGACWFFVAANNAIHSQVGVVNEQELLHLTGDYPSRAHVSLTFQPRHA